MRALMVAGLAACGNGPTVANTHLVDAELVAPWSDWDLPVGNGRVVWCDADSLTVSYVNDRVPELSVAWRTAVRGAGFEEDLDTSAPGLTSVRYLAPPKTLTLTVVVADSVTTVAAALVDEPNTVAP